MQQNRRPPPPPPPKDVRDLERDTRRVVSEILREKRLLDDEALKAEINEQIDLEMIVNGCMMMMQDAPITAGMASLHVNHFTVPRNRATFQAICRIQRRRAVDPTLAGIDIVVVHEELKAMGKAAGRDGNGVSQSYLIRCTDAVPSTANIDWYIKRLLHWSRTRHISLLGREMARCAAEAGADPLHLSNASRKCLDEIAERGWCDIAANFEIPK